MKDPARLLDQGATSAELSLLRAGASEEPSEQAVQRLASVLGLASGAVVSTSATKSSAAGSVAHGVASKLATKWSILGAIGVVGGAAFVLGRTDTRDVARQNTHAANATGSVAASAMSTASTAIAVAGTTTPNGVTVEQNTAAASASSSRSAAGSEAPATGSASIAKEIAALDVARRLLASDNPRGALDALDDYEKATKVGMLRQEATLLRIEALAAAGERAPARRLATRFLRAHPNSPHEKRLRALIGESP